MAIIVIALENNLEQDFLGKMYMDLELSSHWKGQYFTPYELCQMMAEMTLGDRVQEEVEQKGYITISDPACGAGATLIAAANLLKRKGINFQNHVLFVGQDIDRVVALMCYIQLSLIGCPGYIAVADTLTHPLCGTVFAPLEEKGQELWYMPMFATQTWGMRRMFDSLEASSRIASIEKTVEKECTTASLKEAETENVSIQKIEKTEEPEFTKVKRKNDEIEGQMDFFSLLGMNGS